MRSKGPVLNQCMRSMRPELNTQLLRPVLK
jgi:hypothetical protein